MDINFYMLNHVLSIRAQYTETDPLRKSGQLDSDYRQITQDIRRFDT